VKKELIEYLKQFVFERRAELFENVIQNRTRYITVVLEDIFQAHNASAVLRTAECFGIQDIHIIENRNQYTVSPDVALGSPKWLNLKKYNKNENNTLTAINELKQRGYRIVATTPHTNDVNLEDFDLNKGKIALFFGTEQHGLSHLMIDHADEYLKIPMYGFTESFNISVSAAIVLHHLTYKLRQSNIDWKLSEQEKIDILFEWLKRAVKKSNMLIEKFLSQKNAI